ncbi:MAG: arylsulfatase [Pirellulaceae bacterium]|nr:arylsulfatase [Pirellulaceae bacterium]
MIFSCRKSCLSASPFIRLVVVAIILNSYNGNAHSADAKSLPNVVVLLADDAGWGDYGINGNQMANTPNIDSIGRNGARFDRFYVCSVCAPTRAEFLTGRYHSRGGVRGVSTGQERLNTDENTIADAFKKAGYSTGAFGKWHNGSQWPYHPMARGFQQYYGHTSGHWGEYFDPPLEHNGQMIRDPGYIVDLCTSRAIEFIEANRDRPFFCYVPFTTPHSPWAAPEENWRRYKDKPIPQQATDPKLEVPERTRCAHAMLENQDGNVGRILKRLNELKLKENTIVVYFSDNGPNTWRWNDGMKGRKGSTDEGGLRSPAMICWPKKIPANIKVTQIAGAIDLLPTLTSLAGISRVGEKPLDGVDLSPLLKKGNQAWPERQIFSHQNGSISVRTPKYRLDANGGLFDMLADPAQTRDIREEQPAIAESLSKSVAAWSKDVFGFANSTDDAPADKGKEKGKGKNANKRVIPDDRAFPVGYTEFPWTQLPARDGIAHGGVQRSSSAPNCSYFVNWQTKDDSMTWDIDVHTAGTYEVVIDYTCPIADAGSKIELTFMEKSLNGKVSPGWDPPLYTNQDTLPRPDGESTMKEFRPLNVGKIELPVGRGLMTLRAMAIPGKSVMDVRRINLTLLK